MDERKLGAWLASQGLDMKIPENLMQAKLAPLWSFLGFARAGVDSGETKQTLIARQASNIPHIASLFPPNASSERVQEAMVSSRLLYHIHSLKLVQSSKRVTNVT